MKKALPNIVTSFFLWAFLLSVSSPSGAFAYVPQGAHLLELMIEEIGRPDSMLVIQQHHFLDVAGGEKPVVCDETLRYQLPYTFRSDMKTDRMNWIRLTSGRRSISILNGRRITSRPEGFDLYPELLLIRNRHLLSDRLVETGIDVSRSSLGRFQGNPVYVIGAKFPDLSQPQLWLDKKTLYPVRWIVRTHQNQAMKEIRYLDWADNGPYGYPMRIEFYRDGVLVRRAEVRHFAVNEYFEADLFDINRLFDAYPSGITDGGAEEAAGSGAVQESIDEFRKIMD